MEIDLDIHAWAYLARKAFSSYIPRLGTVVFENAFVVQVGMSARHEPAQLCTTDVCRQHCALSVHTLQDTLTLGIPHLS